MSGWKGGGVLLVLAIPLAAYAGWYVKDVARPGMVLSDAPPDRGASKDQLVAAKTKASAWAGDVRKTAWVAQQYRAKDANDAVGEKAAADTIKVADDRAAYFTDLDQFLSGTKEPTYRSTLAKNFVGWGVGMKETDDAKRAVDDWLNTPVQLNTAADADARVADLKKLLAAYNDTGFARRELSAVWLVRGQLKVIEQLIVRADKEYPDALKVSLPLKSGDNAMKSALAAFVALRRHASALPDEDERDPDKVALFKALGDTRAKQLAAAKSAATGAAGREKLLALFAQDTLFSDPTIATAWLSDVNALYRDAKGDDQRKIRKKVQEFCEAFLPAVVRLDNSVLVNGKSTPRAEVRIKYRKDGMFVRDPLSDDPAGLTEFAAAKFDKETTFVLAPSEYALAALEPTALSKAAVFYNEARAAVLTDPSGLTWTVKTVEGLKNKCEDRKDLVNKLKPLRKKDATKTDTKDDPKDDGEAKLFARLEGLLAGLRANQELVEAAP